MTVTEKKTLRLAVVVPTFNEVDNIDELVHRLLAIEQVDEIVFVDDNSSDGTAAKIIEQSRLNSQIRLISRPRKLGLGSAYAAGMKWALAHNAGAVITMDADLSHDPEVIPQMLQAMDDYDLVIGSRYVKGGRIENWGLGRRALSATANFLTRVILSIPAKDCTAGFRLYRREVSLRIKPETVMSHGYSYLEEMIFRVTRSGFSIGEVPIVFHDRRAGESKISRSEIVRGLWTLLRLWIVPPKS